MKRKIFVPITAAFLCLALLTNVLFFKTDSPVNGGFELDENTNVAATDLNADVVSGSAQTIKGTVSKLNSGKTVAHGTTVSTDKDGNKVFTFTYNGKTYDNEFDRLMAEDGFIYGLDWDWFGTWSTNINALGDDPHLGATSRYRADYVERALYNMHALGNNAMGTWLGPQSCFKYDYTTGHVVGLDEKFRKNLINLLESCRKTDMDLVPALLSHGDNADYYDKSVLDKESSEIFDFFLRFYYDKEAQDSYFKNWVEPVCEILSQYQDVIPIVALTIENGTELNDIETGEMYWNRGLTWDGFASLNNRLHDTVKKYMPNVLTSIEDVGNPSYMYKYNDLKVDIISPQKYEEDGIFPDNEQWMKTRAGYLGEFNYAHGGDYTDVSIDYLDIIAQRFYKDARQKGYLGAFYFMWSTNVQSRWNYFLSGNSDEYEQLRNFAVPVSYIINDLKHEHRGTTGKDKPTLFYNNESTSVYWIGCRGAEGYTLERSDNGGAWKTIAKDIDPIDNSITNGLVTYIDETLPTSGSCRYRVIAHYEGGEKVYSDAGNKTKKFIPIEKFVDSKGNYVGDFEKGDAMFVNEKITNWVPTENADAFKWETNGKLGKVVDGGVSGKCLYGNTEDGTSASAGYGAQWNYLLNVTPGATHEFSVKYKTSSTGTICFSINPLTEAGRGNQIGYVHCYVPDGTAEDAEWVENRFVFTAPESGKIALYSRVSGEGEFWVDDISIKEIR